MGLSDRDYARDQHPLSGLSAGGADGPVAALRMWSVNTWIIAICVAVFVVDGFLPHRFVATGVEYPAEVATMDRTARKLGQQFQHLPLSVKQPNGETVTRNALVQSVVERSTGNIVGWAEVHEMKFLESFLHFSTRLGFFGFEWWRFVGFQFLHASLPHVLFNMLGLYFFGPLVERYLGPKRYLAFYLLCGMCGAIMYLILNLAGYIAGLAFGAVHIPGLLFDDPSTPLVGASAGIFGVLMAGAFLAPRETVLLFFVIPMQLRTLAYVLVALALYRVFFNGENAGGEAGHLGGAIAGFYFIRHPHHLHNFFDVLGRVDPTSHHYRDGGPRPRAALVPRRDEIDRILDKINADGLQSLTETEKRTLRDASRSD